MRSDMMRGPIAWMATNPIAANLFMLLVFFAGMASLGGIKKEVFPTFPTEMFKVTVVYPGSSPEEIENGIVIKVEEALRDIVGIKEINSVAQEGLGVVTVTMNAGSDMSKVLNQAKGRVDSIAAFPMDAEEPVVEEIEARGSAMRLSLYGDVAPKELKVLAEQVRDDILELEHVSEVSMLGDREYELSIEVPTEKLRQYDLDFDQLAGLLRKHSQDLPGGVIRASDGTITLRSISQAYTAAEYSAITVISRPDGTRVQLGDIAIVRDGFKEQAVLSRFNGKPAITLVVDRVGDQNVLQLTDNLSAYVIDKNAQLPDGIEVAGWIDRSQVLRGRIQLLLKNAAQGAVLVMVALALFLDVSLAFWVMLGVPFAVLGTLATIFIFDLEVSINVLSVFAFILVLGILVDDGIVTAEAAYASLEREQNGIESIVAGVRKVATATIFGALTTMIAFGPTVFLSEGFARAMSQMGPVVIFCLIFSLLETKLILPAHLRHLKVTKRSYHGWQARLYAFKQTFSEGIRNFANGPYQRALKVALAHRYTTLSIFLGVLVICLALVPSGIVRFVFFPNVASDRIHIILDMPQGSHWQKTHDVANEIRAAALEMDRRHQQVDPLGRSAIKHLLVVSETDTQAKVDIELISSEVRDITSVQLAQWFREELGPTPGIRALKIDANAGAASTPLMVKLNGKDLEQLKVASIELRQGLLKVAGVQDVRDSLDGGGRELDIRVSPEGEALGLGSVDLARQVRQAFYGAEVQRVQRGRHEVRVYLRLPETERASRAALDELWIRIPDGRKMPFSVVGLTTPRVGVSVINRIDRQRVVTVEADINKREVEPGAIIKQLQSSVLPEIMANHPSVHYEFGGETDAEQRTSSMLKYGAGFVLLMIFGALAVPLKSYISPMLIMSVIPFGVIGAILGHLILGSDISVLSVIGIIGLIGVVVNDSLVLVDFINHDIAAGDSWQDAVMKAGPARFRAVVLTSLTTFLGLLPIQLETSIQSEFVKPMAISVSFGVLFASFVTLFLVPTLYYIGKDIEHAGRNVLRRLRGQPQL